MKFSISSESLKNVLNSFRKIVPRRAALPALRSIEIFVTKNGLVLTGTDLESYLVVKCGATVSTVGETLLDFQTLLKFVGKVSGRLVFSTDKKVNQKVNIETEDGGRISLPLGEIKAFPTIPKPAHFIYSICGYDLHRAISKTLPFCSDDDLHPQLEGIFIEVNKKYFRFASTDMHTLSIYTIASKVDRKEDNFILPTKAANVLQALLSVRKNGESPLVSFGVDNEYASFRFENSTLITKCVVGKYPNYKGVIPQSNENVLTCDVKDLANILERVDPFTNEITHQIICHLNKECSVEAYDSETGAEFLEKFEAKYKGKAMNISYNASFVSNILRQIDIEKIQIKFGTSGSAAILKPVYEENDEEEDLLFLLMPIKLPENFRNI